MTEQEQVIANFKSECQVIIAKYASEETQDPALAGEAKKEMNELADDIVNRHSNMPNIDIEQLKEALYSTAKKYADLMT